MPSKGVVTADDGVGAEWLGGGGALGPGVGPLVAGGGAVAIAAEVGDVGDAEGADVPEQPTTISTMMTTNERSFIPYRCRPPLI